VVGYPTRVSFGSKVIEARLGPNGARVYRARVYYRGRYVASRTFPRKRDAQEWERKQVETLKTGAWADPKAGERPVNGQWDFRVGGHEFSGWADTGSPDGRTWRCGNGWCGVLLSWRGRAS
jgi:hypothetical protein